MPKPFLVKETSDPLVINLAGIPPQGEEPPVLATASLAPDNKTATIVIGTNTIGAFELGEGAVAKALKTVDTPQFSNDEKAMILTLMSAISSKCSLQYATDYSLMEPHVENVKKFAALARAVNQFPQKAVG